MCQSSSISLLILSLGSFAGCTWYSKVTGYNKKLGFCTYVMVHVDIFSCLKKKVKFVSDIFFFRPSPHLPCFLSEMESP